MNDNPVVNADPILNVDPTTRENVKLYNDHVGLLCVANSARIHNSCLQLFNSGVSPSIFIEDKKYYISDPIYDYIKTPSTPDITQAVLLTNLKVYKLQRLREITMTNMVRLPLKFNPKLVEGTKRYEFFELDNKDNTIKADFFKNLFITKVNLDELGVPKAELDKIEFKVSTSKADRFFALIDEFQKSENG
jgi:hypothetical protein